MAAEGLGRRTWNAVKEMAEPFQQGEIGATTALTMSGFHGIKNSKIVWLTIAMTAIHIAVQVTWVTAVALFIAPFDPQALDLILNAQYLRTVLRIQASLPMIVMGAYVGARITSRDRMMGGLEFLLSKAIKPSTYVVARLGTPTVAAFVIMFLPVLVLELLIVLMVRDLPDGIGRIFWGALGAGLVATFVLGPLSAGLGALVDNPRRAIALWLAVVFVTAPLAALALSINLDWWWAVSPLTTLEVLSGWMMGQDFPGDNVGLAWLIVIALAVVPIIIMRWRIGEVVR